jgi:hypothetical protein
MKLLLLGTALLLCQGCTTLNTGSKGIYASAGVYNPATLDSVDSNKYKADKQQCFKQIQSESENSMYEHNSILKFRECLIKKGYVLLS